MNTHFMLYAWVLALVYVLLGWTLLLGLRWAIGKPTKPVPLYSLTLFCIFAGLGTAVWIYTAMYLLTGSQP